MTYGKLFMAIVLGGIAIGVMVLMVGCRGRVLSKPATRVQQCRDINVTQILGCVPNGGCARRLCTVIADGLQVSMCDPVFGRQTICN